MADEKPILGIVGTINGSDITEGANNLIGNLARVEKSAKNATESIQQSTSSLNKMLDGVIEKLDTVSKKLLSLGKQQQQQPVASTVSTTISVSTSGGATHSVSKKAIEEDKQALKDVQKLQQQNEKELEKESKAIANLSGKLSQLYKKQEEAGGLSAKQLQEMAKLEQQLIDLEQKRSEQNDEFEAARFTNQIEQVQKQLQSLRSKANGVYSSEIAAIEKDIEDHQKRANELSSVISDNEAEITKLEASIADSAEAAKTLTVRMREIKESLQSMSESGMQNTEEYRQQEEEYKRIKAVVDEVNDALKDKAVISAQTELRRIRLQMATLSANGMRGSAEYQELAQRALELDKAVKATNQDLNSQSTFIERLFGGATKYQQVLSALPPAMQQSIAGLTGMVRAARAFIATPFGLFIAAIALALKGLNYWFENTTEGAEFFAKATGYLQGILQSVMNILKQYVRTMASYAKLLKEVFTWGDIEGAFKNLAKESVALSIEFLGAGSAAYQMGESFAAANVRALQLQATLEKWTNKKASLLAELAQQEAVINSPYSSPTQRANARRKKIELSQSIAETELSQKKESLANMLLEGQTSSGKALDTSKLANGEYGVTELHKYGFSKEDAQKLIETQAQITEMEGNLNRAKKANQDELRTIEKEALDAHREYIDNTLALDQKLLREEQDIEALRQDYATSILADSFEKRMAVRRQAHEKEMLELKRELEDAKIQARQTAIETFAANPNKPNRNWDESILSYAVGSDDYNQLDKHDQSVVRRYQAQMKQSQDLFNVKSDIANRQYNDISDLMNQYQSYVQKKLNIDLQYQEGHQRIQEAIAAYELALQGDITEEQKKSYNELIRLGKEADKEMASQYRKSLATVESEKKMIALKQNPNYTLAMQDTNRVQTQALKQLQIQLEGLRDEFASLDPEKAQTFADLVERINESLIERNPTDQIKRLTSQSNDLRRQSDTLSSRIQFASESGAATVTWMGKELTIEEATNELTVITTALSSSLRSLDEAVEKSAQRWKEVFGYISDIGGMIGGKAGNILSGIGSIGQTWMDSRSQFSFSNMQSRGYLREGATDASWGSMNGFGKASTIMAAAGAAYSTAKTIADTFGRKSSQGEYEKAANKQAEINNLTQSVYEYQRAVLAAQQAEDNWFGKDSLGGLSDAWENASKVRDQYFAKLNEQQETYHNKDKDDNWSGAVASAFVGAISGAITGAALTSETGPGAIIGAAIGAGVGMGVGIATNNLVTRYDGNQTAAVDNLRIETRRRKKSFLGIGGHDQETADLRTWAKDQFGADLFDKEGWINKELATQILEGYGDKLQGETQATLEALVKAKEEYDEYMAKFKEYVSSLYEPIVSNMTDALWDWFDSGKDALASFREYAADTFRNIVNDMLKTIILKKVVAGYQDQIEQLYEGYSRGGMSEESLMRQVADKTGDLINRYEASLPTLQGMLTTISDITSAKGLDLHNTSNATAARGVQASFSQDSIDEANGRMASIQMQMSVMVDIQYRSADHLSAIANHTSQLSLMRTLLEDIKANTQYL